MTTLLERPVSVAELPAHSTQGGRGRSGRRRLADLCGVGSVVAVALAYLSPAVKDGFYFGPLDAARNGIIGRPASLLTATVHNRLNGDLMTLSVPWNTLDHRLVWAGQFPLWNPDSLLGLPQFFNFQSATLSLPDLVSYAVPLRIALFVAVLVKLLVAGTGTYVLCRLCRTRPLAASFGAVTFMLSGGFANWLGWSLADVVAFAPWICAFAILCYRRRGVGPVAGLALSVMFSLYGGFPEVSFLLAVEVAVFIGAAGLASVLLRHRLSAAGALRLAGGGVLGVLLAAPLLLPGGQLLSMSAYVSPGRHDVNLPGNFLSLLFAPGYYGLPIAGSTPIAQVNYYETVSYVGALAVALALTGLVLRRRRPLVIGMAVLAVVGLLASYRVGTVDPAGVLFNAVGLGDVHSSRARIVAALGIAVLAAVGVDEITSRPRACKKVFAVAASCGVAVTLCLVGSSLGEHLRGWEGRERVQSLLWPCGLALVLVLAAAALLSRRRDRRSPALGGGLCVVQAAFLLFAGVGINSYSASGPPAYAATRTLERIVGSDVVGLDGRSPAPPRTWEHVGFYPNENLLYGIDEFAGHDPALPSSYPRVWPSRARNDPHRRVLSTLLMPDISSAAEARRDSVSYLLVRKDLPLPRGTVLVADIGGEKLARVPGASRFRFRDTASGGNAVLSSSHPSDNSWTVHVSVSSRTPSSRLLVVGLTDVPGFSAVDRGRVLPLRRYGHFEMAVTVPPGRSSVTITYWPSRFKAGIVIACVACGILLVWAVLALFRPRRRPAHRPR